MPDDFVDYPIKNVENQKGQWETSSGYRVYLLGPVNEHLSHLIRAFWYSWNRIIWPLLCHSVLCWHTWAHSICCNAKLAITGIIILLGKKKNKKKKSKKFLFFNYCLQKSYLLLNSSCTITSLTSWSHTLSLLVEISSLFETAKNISGS